MGYQGRDYTEMCDCNGLCDCHRENIVEERPMAPPERPVVIHDEAVDMEMPEDLF